MPDYRTVADLRHRAALALAGGGDVAVLACVVDQLQDDADVRWLGQVIVKAGGLYPLPSCFVIPTSERSDVDVSQARNASKRHGDIEATHLRHSKVEENDFWAERFGKCQGLGAGVGHSRFVAVRADKQGEHPCRVRVVVDNQHLPLMPCPLQIHVLTPAQPR